MTLYILAFLIATLLFVNLVFLKNKSFGKKFSYSIAIVAAFIVFYVGIVTLSFGRPERPTPKKPLDAVVSCEDLLDRLIKNSNFKSSFKDQLHAEIENRDGDQIKVSLHVIPSNSQPLDHIVGWIIIDLNGKKLLDITNDIQEPIELRYRAEDWSQLLICYKADSDLPQLIESDLSESDYENSRADDQNLFLKDTITFPSVNGTIELPTAESTVVFKNNIGEPHDEDIETFKYLGSYTALKKYLLEVHLYEDSFHLLVDQQTGLIDTLQGMPYFSPDHSKIFSSQEVFEDGDNDQLMFSYNYLYNFRSEKIDLLTTINFKWLVRECYWKNNQTIYIKASTSKLPASYFYKKISLNISKK